MTHHVPPCLPDRVCHEYEWTNDLREAWCIHCKVRWGWTGPERGWDFYDE